MKAKKVYLINLNQDSPNSAPNWIVAFDSGKGDKNELQILELGGQFTVKFYADKFAELLLEGGA